MESLEISPAKSCLRVSESRMPEIGPSGLWFDEVIECQGPGRARTAQGGFGSIHDRFGARLGSAIPFEREDPTAEAILRAAVTGVNSPAACGRPQQAFGDNLASPAALAAYARLRQLTELEPFFAD